jgi:hypothetical protein
LNILSMLVAGWGAGKLPKKKWKRSCEPAQSTTGRVKLMADHVLLMPLKATPTIINMYGLYLPNVIIKLRWLLLSTSTLNGSVIVLAMTRNS